MAVSRVAERLLPPRVGVLALQGAFREHRQAFERLGAEVREVRLPGQLEGLSGLVIPGGESTTMAKLMVHYGFDRAIPEFARGGGGVWGTCAGAIVAAREILQYPEQLRFGLVDMAVARNAYGRQRSSFETDLAIDGLAEPFRAVFIRAPRIIRVGAGVRALAVYDGDPVAVADGAMVATVFHPELTGDDRFHALVLQLWLAAATTNGV
jgi:5'-phosphate synthase pdxT subunit